MERCDIASDNDILVIQLNRPMDGEQFYQLVGAIARVMPEQKILFVNGVDVESIVVLSEGDCADGGGDAGDRGGDFVAGGVRDGSNSSAAAD